MKMETIIAGKSWFKSESFLEDFEKKIFCKENSYFLKNVKTMIFITQ